MRGFRTRAHRAGIAIVVLFSCGGAAAFGQWGMGGARGIGGVAGDAAGSTPPSAIAFRPWVSAQGSYTQVVGQQRLDSTRRDFYGYGAAAGASGAKGWERTSIAGFYLAAYQQLNGRQGIAGMSQVAGLTLSHRPTEKVGLYMTQFAGSSLGGFGYGAPAGALGGWGVTGASIVSFAGMAGGPLTDFGDNGLVDNELFGTRVSFYGTSAGASYRPNLRWSFGGGAQAAFVRRKGSGLRDLNSAGVFGSAAYQAGQRTVVGLNYGMSEFSYPKLFGDNRAQFATLSLQHQITQRALFTMSGGAYKMDTTYLGAVEVDPVVAELLGVQRQIEVQKRAYYGWIGMASISKSWREWGGSISYVHTLNPGNGLILASKRDSVFGSMNRSLGRLSFGLFGGYYRWSGLLERATLTSASAGTSVGIRTVRDLHVGMNAGYSLVDLPTGPRRWQRFVSAHVTWTPSLAAFRF